MSDRFYSDDFQHTADLLRSGNDALVDATLSNNRNIILAALDIAGRVDPFIQRPVTSLDCNGFKRLRFLRACMDQGFIKLSLALVDEVIAEADALYPVQADRNDN